MPLVEATTLTYLGSHSARYGRIRSWGSVGFIVAVLGLGYAFDFIAIAWILWVGVAIKLGILFLRGRSSRPKFWRITLTASPSCALYCSRRC